MGIPHLTSQLRPFATSISWQRQNPNVGRRESDYLEYLVVDGPSLAYYIYHRCLAAKHDARNPLEAVPMYQELGDATIAWLEYIESYALCVKHICFDGFLPASKIDTRFDRLAKSLLQLRNYYSSNPYLNADGVTRSPLSTASAGFQRASSRLTAVPAPPFLVPAIIDALCKSKYEKRTRVVPCEAEVECAKGVNDIILTNDSDLILLAGTNRVLFFNDLDISTPAQSNEVLSGFCYDGTDLSTKLNCPDLIKLAFFLTQGSTRSLQNLAKQANQPTFPSDHLARDYTHFKAAYTPESQYSSFAWATESNIALSRTLTRLDPRISEFIQQWGAALGNPSYPLQNRSVFPQIPTSASRHMFLPFLLDNPTRASAWRTSREVRRLAYSVMALYGPKFQMLEVDRRGERVVGTPVQLIDLGPAIMEACRGLLGVLPRAEDGALGPLGAESWSLMALFRVLAALKEEGASLPTRAEVRWVFAGTTGVESWAHVHLSAQIEGYVYSLRILCQFLEVWMAADVPHEPEDSRAILASLLETLRRLPPLSEVLRRAGGGFVLSKVGLEDLERGLEELYGIEGVQASVGQDFVEEKRKKKRRRKGEQSNEDKKKKLTVSTNMYDLLEES